MTRRIFQNNLRMDAEKVRSKIGVRSMKAKKRLQYRSVKSSPVFAHVTCYAEANAGDTVLSECVRRTVRQGFGEDASWRLVSVYRPVSEQTIQQINASDALFIGGGGLFLPDTNLNSISGWQWACSQDQLKEIRVPVILYTVGYNYFRGQEPGKLFIENLNAIIEKSSFVGLRNMGSVEAVRSLVQEPLRGKICYQPCTTTLIRRILPALPAKKETGKIAFNFAFDRSERRFGEKQTDILRETVKSMYLLRDKGYEIYLIAHCTMDLSVISMIQERKGIHLINATAWDLEKLAGFYNDMDVVLGMRGHAQMIPFGVNCHIISLGSHEKMRWFLEDIGAEDWYIELTEDIPSLADRIVEKFTEIHERHGEETTGRIVRAQERLMTITDDNMQAIRAIVEDEKRR